MTMWRGLLQLGKRCRSVGQSEALQQAGARYGITSSLPLLPAFLDGSVSRASSWNVRRFTQAAASATEASPEHTSFIQAASDAASDAAAHELDVSAGGPATDPDNYPDESPSTESKASSTSAISSDNPSAGDLSRAVYQIRSLPRASAMITRRFDLNSAALAPTNSIRPIVNCDHCTSATQMLAKLAGHYDSMSAIEINAALHKAAKIRRNPAPLSDPAAQQQEEDASLELLGYLSSRFFSSFPEWDTKSLIKSLSAYAKMLISPLDEEAWQRCMAQLKEGLPLLDSEPRWVVDMMWSLAKLERYDVEFFHKLVDQLTVAAEGGVVLAPEQIVKVLMAFAEVSHNDMQFMMRLLKSAVAQLPLFSAAHLNNLLAALAKLYFSDADILTHIAQAATAKLSAERPEQRPKPYQLSLMCWSMARMRFYSSEFLNKAAEVAAECAGDMSVQNLSNTAWAYARQGHYDPGLFEQLCKEFQAKISTAAPQNLSNFSWALARLIPEPTPMHTATLRAIADAMIPHLQQQQQQGEQLVLPQNMSNLARAISDLKQVHEPYMQAMVAPFLGCLEECGEQNLSDTVLSFSRQGLYNEQLFTQVAATAASTINNFSPPTLADLAEAYAVAGHKDERLMKGMSQRAVALMAEGSIGPGLLARLVESFAMLGYHDAQLLQTVSDVVQKKVLVLANHPEQLQLVLESLELMGHHDPKLQQLREVFGLEQQQQQQQQQGEQQQVQGQ